MGHLTATTDDEREVVHFYNRAFTVATTYAKKGAYNRWFDADDVAAEATMAWMKADPRPYPTWRCAGYKVLDALRKLRPLDRSDDGENFTTPSDMREDFGNTDPNATSALEKLEAMEELEPKRSSPVARLREAYRLHGWGEKMEAEIAQELVRRFEDGRSYSEINVVPIRVMRAVRDFYTESEEVPHVTHQQIADEARTSRESASRVLGWCVEEGLMAGAPAPGMVRLTYQLTPAGYTLLDNALADRPGWRKTLPKRLTPQ